MYNTDFRDLEEIYGAGAGEKLVDSEEFLLCNLSAAKANWGTESQTS